MPRESLVRAHGRVVGCADVDRGVVDRAGVPAGTAEDARRTRRRSRPGTARCGGRGQASDPAGPAAATKPGQRRRGAVAAVARAPPATGPWQQVVVQVGGVGVGDDDVGASRSPSASCTPATRPPSTTHRGHVGARSAPRTPRSSARSCTASPEPAQPAADVPGAERLLDVRHDRQRGGSPPRVGAGVGGVAVQEHPQPRVAQIAPAQAAQRLPWRDGAHVRRTAGQPQQVATAVQRRLEERAAGHLPHRRARGRGTGPSRRRPRRRTRRRAPAAAGPVRRWAGPAR